MKTNIILLLTISILTYAMTMLLTNNNIRPTINEVPNKAAIQKNIQNTEAIPNFTFTDINGKTHSASDYKGKIIILNFWASWCAPCIKEFPNLLYVAKTYNKDTVLIALSSDLNETAIQSFIKKMQTTQNLDFSADNILVALDENQEITAKKFSTFKLPETIIIDREFKIRNKLIGADWSTQDLSDIIESLI